MMRFISPIFFFLKLLPDIFMNFSSSYLICGTNDEWKHNTEVSTEIGEVTSKEFWTLDEDMESKQRG